MNAIVHARACQQANVGAPSRSRSNGQFVAPRDRLVLYRVARDVALVAARRAGRESDPATVTQREWNAARHAVASVYGHVPQANEVCRQLRDRNGTAFPWSELLAAVFHDSRDLKGIDEDRLRESPRLVLMEHVEYALVRVAHSLRRDTLLPHEYDEQREALLRAATRSGRKERLARLLPTRDQIEHVTGGWNGALSSVGLRTRRPAKPLPRAVVVAPATSSSHHGPYERVEVIDQVREFLLSLPSGAQATHRRWRSFSRGEDGIPSLNVLQRHGGLRKLTAEAVRPDWHDRAVRWETNRPRAIPRRPARRPAPHATAWGVERRITTMLLLRKTGPAGARELAAKMEISRVRVWQMLVELEKRGYVTPTETNPRSSKQRYLLEAAGSEALSDAQELRRILRRPLVSTIADAGTRRRSDETVKPA